MFSKGFPITEIHFCLEHRNFSRRLSVPKAALYSLEDHAEGATASALLHQSRCPHPNPSFAVKPGSVKEESSCNMCGFGLTRFLWTDHTVWPRTPKFWSNVEALQWWGCIENQATECAPCAVSIPLNLLRKFVFIRQLLQVSKGLPWEMMTFPYLYSCWVSACKSLLLFYLLYIYCVSFLEIKEGYFTEQAQIPTGSLNLCIMCLLYGDLFTRTKTHKGRNSDKHQTPHSEKEKTIQTRDCCENVFCDENWNCKSLVFIESNATKSLKSVMSPNWWVVWNPPSSRSHRSWDFSASSFVITDFCKRVFHY